MLFSLVLTLLALWQQPDSGEVVISTNVNLVMLDVMVKNPKGGFVPDLKAGDFQVYQDGKKQQIKYFSRDEMPVTMGLVIDNSGSMGPKRPGVDAAALSLVSASNPHDEVFVVNFNDAVSGTPFSDNVPTLRKALTQGKSEGQTKLYDAIDYSLSYLQKGRMDKKTLIVVSDGRDNASLLTRKDITEKVEESRATIYGIDIFDPEDAESKSDVLKKLAQLSGGEFFQLRDVPEVAAVCKQIAADIRRRYTISYIPAQSGVPGSMHSVRVSAGAKMSVRTRTRYIVPKSQ